jgi:hypothetical protein
MIYRGVCFAAGSGFWVRRWRFSGTDYRGDNSPVDYGPAGISAAAMWRTKVASGQAAAKARRTRDAISMTRAPSFKRRRRIVANSAVASACVRGMERKPCRSSTRQEDFSPHSPDGMVFSSARCGILLQESACYRRSDRATMADPTGESKSEALRLDFDRRLMLRFRGSVITSDSGLLAYRELDEVLALTTSGGERLAEARTGKNRRHLLVGLLRQSVFGRLAGYEDVNDADRLCRDPAMRWVVGDRAIAGLAASASQMGRFETKWLCRPENLAVLADLPGQWVDKVQQRRPPKMIVLDMDSSESPTYGTQEGSTYNGHFGCTCYHPLFVFNQFGDLERCALRSGNVHSAADWRNVLEPVVVRYRGTVKRRYFRGDAAFANPEIYEFLEAEGYGYTIRLPTNPVLQGKIGHY